MTPAERWTQATGLVPTAEVIREDYLACYNDQYEACSDPGVIHLLPDATDGVELHELGHQFSRRHLTTGQSGVMVAEKNNASWRECITLYDLDLICSEADCLWQKPECK